MRAVVLETYGGPEVLALRDVPAPDPGPGEVVMRVHACSINRGLDLELRQGSFGFGVTLPHTPGADPAGVVTAVGADVTGIAVGDRIGVAPFIGCGRCRLCLRGEDNACRSLRVFGVHRPGGDADFAAVPADHAVPLPSTLSFEAAACLPLSYAVAWHLLVGLAEVRADDTVLVMAAGSGIGVAGVQIAKLRGARVLAAAGSDEKLERARRLGADAIINYVMKDVSREVRALTDDWGADVVFENIGAATWERSVASLARKGRLVTCGTHGGHQASIDIRALYRNHNTFLFSAGAPRRAIDDVFRLAGEGRLAPVVDRTFPLAAVADAHRYVGDRRSFGKVVLTP
jgi:NADPH:quinone reductase-like Zn-dependent oxidoreductase